MVQARPKRVGSELKVTADHCILQLLDCAQIYDSVWTQMRNFLPAGLDFEEFQHSEAAHARSTTLKHSIIIMRR